VLCKSLISVCMARMMVAYFAESAYKITKFQSSGVLRRLYLEVVANGFEGLKWIQFWVEANLEDYDGMIFLKPWICSNVAVITLNVEYYICHSLFLPKFCYRDDIRNSPYWDTSCFISHHISGYGLGQGWCTCGTCTKNYMRKDFLGTRNSLLSHFFLLPNHCLYTEAWGSVVVKALRY